MDSHHALRTLQKKRTSNFREDETKLLIQLWGSSQIQNKLYLTHRKAPVMRILAANMQRHGFYRTPDEIKTRIRNLKCLYHRIKRTVQSGTGLGTVDPDWPHYKAMDAILSKEIMKKENLYKDNVLEGPKCEDIKQEVEDIDINDDMESYSNSNQESEYEDDTNPLPSLTPAPKKDDKTTNKAQTNGLPTILPNLTNFAIPIPAQQLATKGNNNNRPNGMQSLPFPLLIVQQKPQTNGDDKNSPKGSNVTSVQTIQQPQQNLLYVSETNNLLKDLLDVQKENLTIEKQRLDLEKKKFEYHKNVGSQLLTLVPIFGKFLQNIAYPDCELANVNGETTTRNGRKRKPTNVNDDVLRESKILRTVLEMNLKKYMMGDDYDDEESDKDDSGCGKEDENENVK